MKVFLSWSGDRSHAVAKSLSTWLQLVIQSLEPWISSRDIPKGTLWDPEIATELNGSPVGIIVLTRDNLQSPWILFEAGALFKGATTNRVCTFLVDLKPTDVEQPLAKFNHTTATADDVLKMLRSLNTLAAKPLPDEIVVAGFKAHWPMLEKEISTVIAKSPGAQKAFRRPEDIMVEMLELVRGIDIKLTLSTSANTDKNLSVRSLKEARLMAMKELASARIRLDSAVGERARVEQKMARIQAREPDGVKTPEGLEKMELLYEQRAHLELETEKLQEEHDYLLGILRQRE